MSNQSNRNRRHKAARKSMPRDNRGGVFGKIIVMLAVVVAVVLCVAIFFRVHDVQIQGNKIYSAQQVAEVSGVESGDNLLMISRATIAGNIYANLPYVQTVSVGRVLPDTVVIKVQESEIAGLVKSDIGTGWYINTQGRVLGSSVDGFNGQLIELEGFTITAPQPGQQAVASVGMEENLKAALSVVQQLEGTGLISQVTSIDTQESFNILLYCGEQYEVQLGGDDRLDYKVWYLQEVLNQLADYQTGVIDLTLDVEQAARFIPWKN